MSQRNTLANKRIRRAQRSLSKPLPAQIDLIEYVKHRVRCTTTRAMQVIMTGCLRVDSHPIGVKEVDGRKVFERYVPAEYAKRIVIVEPEGL